MVFTFQKHSPSIYMVNLHTKQYNAKMENYSGTVYIACL